jgi:hypothetical protein
MLGSFLRLSVRGLHNTSSADCVAHLLSAAVALHVPLMLRRHSVRLGRVASLNPFRAEVCCLRLLCTRLLEGVSNRRFGEIAIATVADRGQANSPLHPELRFSSSNLHIPDCAISSLSVAVRLSASGAITAVVCVGGLVVWQTRFSVNPKQTIPLPQKSVINPTQASIINRPRKRDQVKDYLLHG